MSAEATSNVRVERATEVDLAIVRNLVPYYIYEMSGPMGWSAKLNGTYGGCDDLAEYWQTWNPLTDPSDRWSNRAWKGYPYLIRVREKLGGFALIRYRPEVETYDVGEFFIVKKHQGQGIGRQVAVHLFDSFEGKWEVWQMMGNTPAQKFWKRVVSDYTNGSFERGEEEHWEAPEVGVVLRFSSAAADP